MTHGHSEALGLSKSTSAYLHLANGCGQTWPIHPKHGQYHHSKGQLVVNWIQIRGHLTIIYWRWAFFIAWRDPLLIDVVYRSVYESSMPLDYWKADFSHCSSFVSKFILIRGICGPSCGSDAVSSSTTLSCELRQGTSIQSGERSCTMPGMQGRGMHTVTGKRPILGVMGMRTRLSYNALVTASWRMDRNFDIESWRGYLTAQQVGLYIVSK